MPQSYIYVNPGHMFGLICKNQMESMKVNVYRMIHTYIWNVMRYMISVKVIFTL